MCIKGIFTDAKSCLFACLNLQNVVKKQFKNAKCGETVKYSQFDNVMKQSIKLNMSNVISNIYLSFQIFNIT